MDEDGTIRVAAQGVAKGIAEIKPITIRETERVRIVLEPKFVPEKEAGVPGINAKLVYHKRSKGTDWNDLTRVKLSTLGADESISLELHSDELAALRDWLSNLQVLRTTHSIPAGETHFIGFRRELIVDRGTSRYVTKVLVPKGLESPATREAVATLLARDDLVDLAAAVEQLPAERLGGISATAGISALDALLSEWTNLPSDAGEERWQLLFEKHSFALQHVFFVPMLFVQGRAYVGGKSLENQGGHTADFLLRGFSTGAAALVEIKTPSTALVSGREYRNGVWIPSTDLAGAVQQVLGYRDSLLQELGNIDRDRRLLRGALPKCAVIVGDSSSLRSDEQRKSFENARARSDVQILTFDELRARLESLRECLSPHPDAAPQPLPASGDPTSP